MLIVSFFTPDYAKHADRLRLSCGLFGYPCWIEAVEDAGKWVHNCARKPAFILRALEATGEPVLWLDADAEIKRHLDRIRMLGAGTDFSIHQCPDEQPNIRFRSGTVLFGDTKEARALLRAWRDLCEMDPNTWDQEHLYHAWKEFPSGIITEFLDRTYCAKFDETDVADPHIVHYQASRQLKRKKWFRH